AFTHASSAADRTASYERLEFLGDSVLELAIAHELYDRYPEFSEGRLAKIRSHVVSRASCAVVARELDLGRRLADHNIGPQAEERSEEHTSELQSRGHLVCRLLLEKKKKAGTTSSFTDALSPAS